MWLVLATLTLTAGSGTGCVAAKLASPDTDLSAQAAIKAVTDLTTGDIGGNGDSIALWLAILSLGGSPLLGSFLYQFGFRKIRLWRKNGNKYLELTNGVGEVCVRCHENGTGPSGSPYSQPSSVPSSSSCLGAQDDLPAIS